MNANELACEVPLVEMLEGVPKDARFVQEKEFSSTYYPVGRLCHEAAAMLRQQQAEIERLKLAALEQAALQIWSNPQIPPFETIMGIWGEEAVKEGGINPVDFTRRILQEVKEWK